MIFLLFQLLIAVLLLHISAAISKKIQIPKLDLKVAKSLMPVVSVNIIGLVFNTLCLRDVEASFFQVMSDQSTVCYLTINLFNLTDCSWPRATSHHSSLFCV